MKRIRLIVGILFGVIVFAFAFLFFLPDIGRFIPLPSTHDSNLVGVWDGHFYSFYSDNRPDQKVYFCADGTGLSPSHGRFWWGTEGGFIHVKHVATDYWANQTYAYKVDTRTHAVSFDVKNWSIIPKSMRRESVLQPIQAKNSPPTDASAVKLAMGRLNLFQAVIRKPESGFRYGAPGSRHWVLFPSNSDKMLYFIDFDTSDGTETITRWMAGQQSKLASIQTSIKLTGHWYENPSFTNNRSVYLLCKEIEGLPLKPRAEDNDRGYDSTEPDFGSPAFLISVEMSEQKGSTSPLSIRRIEPLVGDSELRPQSLVGDTIPVIQGEDSWVATPTKESVQP